jgi:hypothetical protein
MQCKPDATAAAKTESKGIDLLIELTPTWDQHTALSVFYTVQP